MGKSSELWFRAIFSACAGVRRREMTPLNSPPFFLQNEPKLIIFYPILKWEKIDELKSFLIISAVFRYDTIEDTIRYEDTILKAVVDPWARKHFGGQSWTFQQDWAPAHGAKSTLELCKELFPDFWDKDVWPSNSPDLNPLDFSVWSILEQKVCAKRHSSIDELKKHLKKSLGRNYG